MANYLRSTTWILSQTEIEESFKIKTSEFDTIDGCAVYLNIQPILEVRNGRQHHRYQVIWIHSMGWYISWRIHHTEKKYKKYTSTSQI